MAEEKNTEVIEQEEQLERSDLEAQQDREKQAEEKAFSDFAEKVRAEHEAEHAVLPEDVQAEVVAGEIANIDQEIETVLSEQDPTHQEDPVLAAHIEELRKAREVQDILHTQLVNNAELKRQLSGLDILTKWAWERLKKDMKWLFVELPKGLWKVHKIKQEIRNNQKELNMASGLTGEALEEKNRQDMRYIRRASYPQLDELWLRQHSAFSGPRDPERFGGPSKEDSIKIWAAKLRKSLPTQKIENPL